MPHALYYGTSAIWHLKQEPKQESLKAAVQMRIKISASNRASQVTGLHCKQALSKEEYEGEKKR